MMRVVVVLPGYSRKPIGGYRVVYEYCNWLVARGWDVRISYAVLPLRNEVVAGVLSRVVAQGRNSLVRLLYSRRAGSSSVPWFDLDARVKTTSSFRVSKTWCAVGVTVVGTEVSTWAEAVTLGRLRSESSSVIFLQSYEEWAASSEYLDSYLADAEIHKIAISDWLLEEVNRCGGTASKVANAIDPSDFPVGPMIYERPRRVVAMLSPVAEKRADMIFEVFRRLTAQGVEMQTFGIKELPPGAPEGLRHIVRPTRRQLSELLREARVFVCASDLEGWGLPPAEALLSGTAVASTRNGGVEDYAADAALFSGRGDVDELTLNTLRLVDNPDLAQHLTDVGRLRLLEHSPDRAARLFEAELMNGARGE
jgi:glycosyltransferase involved in cell wall biosynthesis